MATPVSACFRIPPNETMIVSNIYTTAAYFLHERVWAGIKWGVARPRKRMHSLDESRVLPTLGQRHSLRTCANSQSGDGERNGLLPFSLRFQDQFNHFANGAFAAPRDRDVVRSALGLEHRIGDGHGEPGALEQRKIR